MVKPPLAQGDSLADMAAALLEQYDQPAIWLGWSLGGLAALHLAIHHPQQVLALGLIATTPSFVQQTTWQHAMPPHVLQKFADNLQQDYRKTVLNFLSLQVSQDTQGRQLLRQLRADFHQRTMPSPHTLETGLNILYNTDIRQQLKHIQAPTWLCLGGRDKLSPSAALPDWQTLWTQPQILKTHCIDAAAHIPFLSHTDECADSLLRFLS